jgi:hypothetical protein
LTGRLGYLKLEKKLEELVGASVVEEVLEEEEKQGKRMLCW